MDWYKFWTYSINSKILPDVKNGVKQLARISTGNSSRTILQSSLNSQPKVFYDIDIWWLGWPYHTMNVVIMLIPLHNPSPMDGGIVVLEHIRIIRKMTGNNRP
jgi:hypothetical protein